ncbi:MAG: HPr family phosphocarrier protein [Pseudomonadales bacterium]|jgi:phosphocarrier protein HPr|nr:HPr family phosphocarrier protein [Pseudomonadales bacterium]MCP5321499.1 HPr family phosphocarrier protein [Pseudomonadales bacterium]MCP5336412.1 HPr family phosphocarrier protein [Pseudomonadales bacterium]
MISKELTIINRLGLHARAAAVLVTTAARFSSRVLIRREGREADAKSIMAVMLLAAGRGTCITVSAEGEDADEAVQAIEALIANRFGEDE